MLPLPRQPPGLSGPQSAAKEAGKSSVLPKMAARPRAGSGTASKSRPFLPFPFFHTNGELPPTLVLFPGSESPGAETERLPAGIGANTQRERRDFRVRPEVTRQSRSPPGGTAGGFRCQPGPGLAVGPALSVSDRSGSQGSGDRGAGSRIRAHRPGLGSSPVPSKNHLLPPSRAPFQPEASSPSPEGRTRAPRPRRVGEGRELGAGIWALQFLKARCFFSPSDPVSYSPPELGT